MVIGRIGCFLAGLNDGTHGGPTSLPWGVDFGDGIPRHPTQLYEIAFLILVAWILFRPSLPSPPPTGLRFRALILSYSIFRLLVDFLKPYDRVLGMNPIQWACLIALCLCYRDLLPVVRTFGPVVLTGTQRSAS
jgi:prolipoprotein diacylglyceryltransferase